MLDNIFKTNAAMKIIQKLILSGTIFSMLAFFSPAIAHGSVVHAVLFYSPTCPHCHKVMEQDLPPLQEKYGDQLDILFVDVTQESGYNLYLTAVEHYKIPQSRFGVPTLIVGDEVLVGSQEIPDIFPRIIASGLESGGIPWPDFPGLKDELKAQNKEDITEEETTPSNQPVFFQKFQQDAAGNTIAVITLLGMIASAIAIIVMYASGKLPERLDWPDWVIPALCVLGMIVAGYLTYIEASHQEAICGPVGDCNSVQTSSYAYLFGVIPIGVLGLAGYFAILGIWLLGFIREEASQFSRITLWGLSWFGVLFSIYLTFLEPFVIGATCMWCITSSIVMTLLLWASTYPAIQALEISEEADDEVVLEIEEL